MTTYDMSGAPDAAAWLRSKGIDPEYATTAQCAAALNATGYTLGAEPIVTSKSDDLAWAEWSREVRVLRPDGHVLDKQRRRRARRKRARARRAAR